MAYDLGNEHLLEKWIKEKGPPGRHGKHHIRSIRESLSTIGGAKTTGTTGEKAPRKVKG